ncbi:MAG: class I SAM-dependent methyltransferase [Rhodoferax sp.]|jgi:SAM-dependent methyltransferase|nr:class I SAM-dependent methyltransferase [Rhodoferax sp.]MCP5287571.1 class I SAM-dependent methyltransferase [Burkholderiaceae bacterium]
MPSSSPASQPPAPSAPIAIEQQIARIFEWRRGFNAMHLIDVGLQLGLWQAWRDWPDAEPAAVAARLGLHPPHVETWCTTAYAFGLLDGEEKREPDGGEAHDRAGDATHDAATPEAAAAADACTVRRRYRLAPHIDVVLASPGHARHLGGYVRLGTAFATEDHRACVESMRSGATAPFQGRSAEFADVVADATFGLQVLAAHKLLPALEGLKPRLDAGGRIVELGCGTGRHLLQLARAFAHAQLVGVDIDPTGLRAARDAVEHAGLGARVRLVEGDIADAVTPGSADAVVMIEVLHEIAPAIRPAVVADCVRALAPGGWLLIVDETYPGTLAEARDPAFRFPVQTGFEELTWGNVLPTRAEQERLLRDAGLHGEIGRSLVGEGFTVLSARKA